MRKFAAVCVSLAIVLFVSGGLAQSAEPGTNEDSPPRDHAWLMQLVGEWESEWTMYIQPGQPPMEAPGTDSVRALGNHWVIAEAKATMMGTPFSGRMSLGYDASKGHFHGTWIDSFGGTMWVYKGALNEAGDALTLETEGPSLEVPGETARYREVIRITGENSRTFKSSYESKDGTWVTLVEVAYQRKASDLPAARDETDSTARKGVNVHYLEIVTNEMDAMCRVIEQTQGVTFSEPAAELGQARTTRLSDGRLLGVRAPIGEEQPVVRPYLLVDDIHAAVKSAEAAGAVMLMPPTEIPGQGTFAIYSLGTIEQGLWQNP